MQMRQQVELEAVHKLLAESEVAREEEGCCETRSLLLKGDGGRERMKERERERERKRYYIYVRSESNRLLKV